MGHKKKRRSMEAAVDQSAVCDQWVAKKMEAQDDESAVCNCLFTQKKEGQCWPTMIDRYNGKIAT